MKNKVLWAKLFLFIHKNNILSACSDIENSNRCNNCTFDKQSISCIEFEHDFLAHPTFSMSKDWVEFLKNFSAKDIKMELNKLNTKNNGK